MSEGVHSTLTEKQKLHENSFYSQHLSNGSIVFCEYLVEIDASTGRGK